MNMPKINIKKHALGDIKSIIIKTRGCTYC